MTQTLPAIFVSHGAPTILIDQSPSHRFLTKLSETTPRPSQILIISAHWETDQPTVSTAETPETIYDFNGFPDALYKCTYPAPGAPELAHRVGELLDAARLGPIQKEERGLDHGAWVPMSLGFPDADIPVTQLSVQPTAGPDHHFRMGEALRPLRDEGVLILGSGSLTHNLYEYHGQPVDAPATEWVRAFERWIAWAIAEGRTDDLLHYRTRAPEAVKNHPTEEHLLPLFTVLGAADPLEPGRHIHSSFSHSVLAMDAFAFGASACPRSAA